MILGVCETLRSNSLLCYLKKSKIVLMFLLFQTSSCVYLDGYCKVSFSMSAEPGEMSKKKNPLVFLDVSIDGDPVERITIEVISLPILFF